MRRALLLLLVLASPAAAAITLHGTATQPADTAAYSTDPLTITPPGSMAADDYVVVFLCGRANSLTWTVSTTGGQTWSSTASAAGTSRTCEVFHTRFNGTWAADPAFDASASVNAHTAYMMVFRGVDTTTALDLAAVGATFGSTTAGVVTITGGTTVTNGAMTIWCWSSVDDNAWTLVGGSGLTQSHARIRNTAGSQFAVSCGWKIVATAGSSGSEGNDETDLGENDSGTTLWMALRPAAVTTTTTTTTSTTTTTTIAAAAARRLYAM